jgi:hypothetical protein
MTVFCELKSHNVSYREHNQQLNIILHNKSEQLIYVISVVIIQVSKRDSASRETTWEESTAKQFLRAPK